MDSDKQGYIILNHTADLGIRVRGKDIKNTFEKAALAMMEIMVKKKPAAKTKHIKLSLKGQDLAELMVLWLGEILYLFSGEKKVITGIDITSISPFYLDATLEIATFNPQLDEIIYEIKAITYHQIEVTEKHGYWEARVFFDL